MDLNRYVPNDAYPAGDMPNYPARVLLQHCALKGVQVGAVFAMIAAPLWAFSRGRPFGQVYHRIQAVTLIASSSISLGMLYKKHLDGELDVDGVDDRAYRLVKNSGQVRVDKYSLVGGGIGATYGAIFGGLGVRSVFSGSVTGVALGVAAYAIEQYAIPKLNEQLK